MIEVDDHVVIFCSKEDEYSLSLPHMSQKVWIARVEDYDTETNDLSGIFLYNKERDITKKLDLEFRDSVVIESESIMSIYSADQDGNPFELDECNINEIEEYVSQAISI